MLGLAAQHVVDRERPSIHQFFEHFHFGVKWLAEAFRWAQGRCIASCLVNLCLCIWGIVVCEDIVHLAGFTGRLRTMVVVAVQGSPEAQRSK